MNKHNKKKEKHGYWHVKIYWINNTEPTFYKGFYKNGGKKGTWKIFNGSDEEVNLIKSTYYI